MFRQGGKVIIPNQTITASQSVEGGGGAPVIMGVCVCADLQDGLLPADEPGHLHLEDVPGQAQRCFAAVRSGVKVGGVPDYM